ncbi:hypothetical protein LPTSP4_09260 [Leptospira ryugenii]|uniref:Uncharacterized protein n=1 Tax=Leptospira ryugenii TaxID=1917863 RepID=A0A2P2DXQ6_9LEPT|nr:hypothetical protein [Leptospira ryugenii]GBF49413.1 hypothetical protein LPTSP4_09260 [Leptospira ryugenii]
MSDFTFKQRISPLDSMDANRFTKAQLAELKKNPEWIRNSIKFSNYYLKFGTLGKSIPKFSALIEVLVVNLEDLSEPFLNYDTRYPGGTFKLMKKGKYLLLFFQDHYNFTIFTTLRKYSKRKEDYYRKRIGKLFRIEIGYE